MIDGGILNFVVLFFKNATIIWAPTIAGIMAPLLVQIIFLGWFFLLLHEVFTPSFAMFGPILSFLILAGFTLAMNEQGYIWVEDLFQGVATIAYMLGVPPLNPSAVASYGVVVADPIMKAIANQGLLSFLHSPLTWSLQLASLAIILAFFILALILTGTLILSFLLTAATPFFMAFACSSFTRPLTMLWVRLVCGCIATLFMIALLTACISELGANMEQWIRTEVLAPGHALTWVDLIGPLAVGVVLIGLFVWLPKSFGHAAYSIIPDWSGGRSVMNVGGAVVNSITPSGSGGGGAQQTSGSSSGGSIGQSSGGGSGWQGGGFGGSQSSTQRPASAWGRK